MRADFVELPVFARRRRRLLDDRGYRELRARLVADPDAGDRVPGAGPLRKLSFVRKARGPRGRDRLLTLWYCWDGESQFWLFTLLAEGELRDPTPRQKSLLKLRLGTELRSRRRMHAQEKAHAVR